MKLGLDPVIHAPLRLQVCAILAGAGMVDFATLRRTADVSESVLSKHVKILAGAGYVDVRKAASGGRQRTWLVLTPAGGTAFAAHAGALRDLLASAPNR
jgi:DNA-binding MarR family transcriptional regulator